MAIDHLTIASGSADQGGGVAVEPGASLTLDHDTLSGNQAVEGAGGGAVLLQAGGTLTVKNGALTNNQATGSSFLFLAGGGAILNYGDATVDGSTFVATNMQAPARTAAPATGRS